MMLDSMRKALRNVSQNKSAVKMAKMGKISGQIMATCWLWRRNFGHRPVEIRIIRNALI